MSLNFGLPSDLYNWDQTGIDLDIWISQNGFSGVLRETRMQAFYALVQEQASEAEVRQLLNEGLRLIDYLRDVK